MSDGHNNDYLNYQCDRDSRDAECAAQKQWQSRATAEQRAKALLRTLNKWKD